MALDHHAMVLTFHHFAQLGLAFHATSKLNCGLKFRHYAQFDLAFKDNSKLAFSLIMC
jgi:hypothetical protein